VARSKHRARVIDQDIDLRLGRRNFGGDTLHLGDPRQIGIVNRVPRTELFQHRPGASLVASYQNQPSAHAGEPLGGD
jgi:hypothetical protein